MNEAIPIINKVDAILGVVVTLLTYIFGRHWFLFVAFLGLNVLDYITGCMKSRIKNEINSLKGAVGIIKKLGYWIMILIGFGMSSIFVELGESIGVNLEITAFVGWYVLATLIINEFRSIIENFVEMNYPIPEVLTKGLKVANDVLDKAVDDDD